MPWILSQLMFFQSSIWTIHSIHSNQRDESSSFCNSIIFQETSLSSIPSICENIRWCDQWIIIVWYNKDSFTIHVVLLQISFEFNPTSLIVEDEVSITHDTSVILVSLIELNVVFHILLFSFESWESIHSLMNMFPCICDIYNNHSIVLCMSNSDVINSHPSYHCFRNCIELSITCIEEDILFLIPQFIPNSTFYDTRNCDRNSMIGFLKRFDICKGERNVLKRHFIDSGSK